jgi:hypothetical protein
VLRPFFPLSLHLGIVCLLNAHAAIDYEYTHAFSSLSESPNSEFLRYEQFLRRELPIQVRRQFDIRIDERLNPLEESPRSELVEIVRDTQVHVFNLYGSLRTSSRGSQEAQDLRSDA